jgi:hypothetical protein
VKPAQPGAPVTGVSAGTTAMSFLFEGHTGRPLAERVTHLDGEQLRGVLWTAEGLV